MADAKNNANNTSKPPFIAFVTDPADLETLRSFAASRQWAQADINQGDIRTAADYLKSNTSPTTLLVEIPSATEAPALLDALADVCDPDTRVMTVGSINEYSFYCWLVDIGIFSYLLKPLTVAALEAAYTKSESGGGPQAKQEKQPGKVISVIGTRGGVGSTTLSINLAGLIADMSQKNVMLVDVDPHEGSVALTLDIDPSRGMREALEKPEKIDSLFIERVVSKPLKNLSILSSEEALHDSIAPHEHAPEIILKELRGTFDIILLDLPRNINAFARSCLRQSDQVVLVTELSLLSLRDALRISDMMRESLKAKPPLVVVNRAGLAPKIEMQVGDFEKGINAKIACKLPFAPDVYMPISAEVPAVKKKTHVAVKPLVALVEQLLPELKPRQDGKAKKPGLFKK